MFAYCNNNPANGYDPCGTCIHNWKFYDCERCAAFWNGIAEWFVDAYDTISSVNQQQAQLEMQITMQQNEMIADAAEATWDAYMRGYNIQQEAQLQHALASQDFIVDRFSTPEKTKNTFAACAVACDAVSVATAACPPVSKGFAIAGIVLGGIAVAIDIYMEE